MILIISWMATPWFLFIVFWNFMLITGINWGNLEARGRHLLKHHVIWCVWKKKPKGLLLSEATHICSVHLRLSSVCLCVCVCVCMHSHFNSTSHGTSQVSSFPCELKILTGTRLECKSPAGIGWISLESIPWRSQASTAPPGDTRLQPGAWNKCWSPKHRRVFGYLLLCNKTPQELETYSKLTFS